MEDHEESDQDSEFVLESPGSWRGEYHQLDRTGWEDVIFLLEDILEES